MGASNYWVAVYGLTHKETYRWIRVWLQSILAPVSTSVLYFLIFGEVIGARIGSLENVSYIHYIAPGLIMMSVIINAYSNVSHSLFISRFDRSIESYLVSSMPSWAILSGFVIGGFLRGITVGLFVFGVAYVFTGITIQHVWVMLLTLFGCSLLFSLAGFLNGLLARDFDDTMVFISFGLTPLIYLGGVFYDVNDLTGIWHTLSLFNPVHYVISLFRYAMLDLGGYATLTPLLILYGLVMFLFGLNWFLLEKGYVIKH